MSDTVLELAVPARFQQVAALRRACDAFLHDSAGEDLRHKLLLVVSELCTNSIEALQNTRTELIVRVHDMPDCITIEVEDRGPGFGSAIGRPPAENLDERGRGLHVVRSLVDDFAVERSYGRTTVRVSVAR
jgi:anti-sigma regulatory factor (Ser/Thr protein kinase)